MKVIREYTSKDEEKFTKLVLSQWEDRDTYLIFEYAKLDPYHWIDTILYNKDYLVLVTNDLQAAICGRRGENYMEVQFLYVHPSKRRNGHAMALKKGLELKAQKEGFDTILTYNRITNDSSRKLNIKAGWKIEPYNDEYYRSSKKL